MPTNMRGLAPSQLKDLNLTNECGICRVDITANADPFIGVNCKFIRALANKSSCLTKRRVYPVELSCYRCHVNRLWRRPNFSQQAKVVNCSIKVNQISNTESEQSTLYDRERATTHILNDKIIESSNLNNYKSLAHYCGSKESEPENSIDNDNLLSKEEDNVLDLALDPFISFWI
ncbi:hypothetical protein GJ496_006381 [Pomphorhynchus laevis]|nr:hypothetical protein GJ496_006381 [Pomphorhynchus laevis]